MAEQMNDSLITIDQFKSYMQCSIPYEGYVQDFGYAKWSYVNFFEGTYTQSIDVRPEAEKLQKQMEKAREQEKREEEKRKKAEEGPFKFNIETRRDASNVIVPDYKIRDERAKFLEYQRCLKELTEKVSYTMNKVMEGAQNAKNKMMEEAQYVANTTQNVMEKPSNMITALGVFSSTAQFAAEDAIARSIYDYNVGIEQRYLGKKSWFSNTARKFDYGSAGKIPAGMHKPASVRIPGLPAYKNVSYETAATLGKIAKVGGCAMAILSVVVIGYDAVKNHSVKKSHLVEMVMAGTGLLLAFCFSAPVALAVGAVFVVAEVATALATNGESSFSDVVADKLLGGNDVVFSW